MENENLRPGQYSICPSCGARSKARAAFCAGCGASLAGVASQTSEVPRATRPRGETWMRAMMALGILTAIGAGLLIRSLFGSAAFVPVEAREGGVRRQVGPLPPSAPPPQPVEMPLAALATPAPPPMLYAYRPPPDLQASDGGPEAWPPDPGPPPRALPPVEVQPRAIREEWRERQDQVREARDEYRDAQEALSDASGSDEEQEAMARLEDAAARLRRAEAALDRAGADSAPAGRRRGRRR